MNRYVAAHIETPVIYNAGGQFVTEKPWKHLQRKINDFELIIGIKDELYIDQQGEKYQVKPGEVLLLLPNTVHTGYKLCSPGTSFYWIHFQLPRDLKIVGEKRASQEVLKLRAASLSDPNKSTIFIPFYSVLSKAERVNIIANQLLDVDGSNYFNKSSVNYLLTTLLIEISEQTIGDYHISSFQSQTDQRLTNVMEWIRMNASESDISVAKVANHFNYNRDYLSRVFKEKTNMNIREYIQRIKVAKAKDLLTKTDDSIKEIAYSVGIKDEKYFMRLFKKYEQITPTLFRRAYYRTQLNNE